MLKFNSTICRLMLVFALFYTSYVTAGPQTDSMKQMVNALASPYPAPMIAGIDSWINSSPLNLQQLTGKIILIEFWNDGCVDCVNALPHVTTWYNKYKDNNFMVIGIHSPIFDFQQSLSNVQQAVTQYGITFPVALDNRLVTWKNFKNHVWPTFYLINKDGTVIYKQEGKADYVEIENNIRFLLGMIPNINPVVPAPPLVLNQTPDIFVGYAQAKNYASVEEMKKDTQAVYTAPQRLAQNQWALQGTWQINADNAMAMATDAQLILHFKANNVVALMGSPGKAVHVLVRVIQSDNTVTEQQVYVTGIRLYSLFNSKTLTDAMLTLTPDTSGLEIYSINFSS